MAAEDQLRQSEETRQDDAQIIIVAYVAAWPQLFEQERAALADILGPWLAGPIEHVGSTAVPGLAAKPIIDIMAGVRSLEESRPAIAVLEAFGYCYYPYQPEQKHWFCKPSPVFRTHHLHLVPFGSKHWQERLAFRDYLRSDTAMAEEYSRLKRRLAEQYEFDREGYTEAKGPFIRRVLEQAM